MLIKIENFENHSWPKIEREIFVARNIFGPKINFCHTVVYLWKAKDGQRSVTVEEEKELERTLYQIIQIKLFLMQ